MAFDLSNWRTQVRKGYLELCLLQLIKRHKRLYGFDLMERMRELDLPVKEGTLYPLLSRMTSDGTLSASWQTDNLKGHPRKFYTLTKAGERLLVSMSHEFQNMIAIYNNIIDNQED